MWDAEVSQVQLHIGLYAKSSYRGFLVAPYDSVFRAGAPAARPELIQLVRSTHSQLILYTENAT
mgnify:CR=1 FL=1